MSGLDLAANPEEDALLLGASVSHPPSKERVAFPPGDLPGLTLADASCPGSGLQEVLQKSSVCVWPQAGAATRGQTAKAASVLGRLPASWATPSASPSL